jgi:uncharacterized protein YodC (DUF2158 family)
MTTTLNKVNAASIAVAASPFTTQGKLARVVLNALIAGFEKTQVSDVASGTPAMAISSVCAIRAANCRYFTDSSINGQYRYYTIHSPFAPALPKDLDTAAIKTLRVRLLQEVSSKIANDLVEFPLFQNQGSAALDLVMIDGNSPTMNAGKREFMDAVSKVVQSHLNEASEDHLLGRSSRPL